MDKSPEAFRTISEVADWLEIPAHVLRFWESRFTQIKPVKRAGGRRYYRPADIALLAGIKKLLHDDGLTIRGVQKILREDGVRHVAGLVPHALADADADGATLMPMTGDPEPTDPGEGEAWPEAPARVLPFPGPGRRRPDDTQPAFDFESPQDGQKAPQPEADPGTGNAAGTAPPRDGAEAADPAPAGPPPDQAPPVPAPGVPAIEPDRVSPAEPVTACPDPDRDGAAVSLGGPAGPASPDLPPEPAEPAAGALPRLAALRPRAALHAAVAADPARAAALLDRARARLAAMPGPAC